MNFQEYIYQLFLGILLGPAWLCGQLGTHWLCHNDAYRQHANAKDHTIVQRAVSSLLFCYLLFSASRLKHRPRLWIGLRSAINGFICKIRALLKPSIKYF